MFLSSGGNYLDPMIRIITIVVSLIVLTALIGVGSFPMRAEDKAIGKHNAEDLKTLVVAGGCFWCVEADFDKLEGVVKTISGYAGGHVENPSYKQVTKGGTGHYEVVKVTYDSTKTTLKTLIDYYWRHVDPTDPGGQFCDRGHSYQTAIFVNDANERALVEASKQAIDDAKILDKPIVTPILDAKAFWPAERYHQNYYKKNPVRYRYYRTTCGRDKRIAYVWRNATETPDS